MAVYYHDASISVKRSMSFPSVTIDNGDDDDDDSVDDDELLLVVVVVDPTLATVAGAVSAAITTTTTTQSICWGSSFSFHLVTAQFGCHPNKASTNQLIAIVIITSKSEKQTE
jgi:hypothetical protein